MITNTVVVNKYQLKPSFKQILFRTFLRLNPFDSFSYLLGLSEGAHDSLSKTRLIILKKNKDMNYSNDIILENAKIRLEPLRMIHFDDLFPITLKYPDLLQFSPSPFGSEALLKANFNQSVEGRTNKVRYPFVIFDKEKKKYIGSTSFGNISMKDKRLEIG